MADSAGQLETLYRRDGAGLLAYLRRRVRDPELAEDLLHETFVQAGRRAERLTSATSPRAWLFGIARRIAMATLRRRRSNAPLVVEPAAADTAEDPRLETMRAAIADLPEPYRETLELRLRCDLSYEEIAAVLEIPVGTVRSRLHAAVQRLRTALVP